MKRSARTAARWLAGPMALAGAMHVQAQDLQPGVTTRNNGEAEQPALRSQGKWLSADCGNIQPAAAGRNQSGARSMCRQALAVARVPNMAVPTRTIVLPA